MKPKSHIQIKPLAFIIAVLFLCAVPEAAFSQPANDNFADAFELTGISGNTTGTNVDATSEPDENGWGKSVWYSWTAPETDIFYFDTHGSGFDTILEVYTGSALGSLTRIAGNYDDGSDKGNSSLIFRAKAVTVYYIAVDGRETGNIVLNRDKVIPRTAGQFSTELYGRVFIGSEKIESSDYVILAFGPGGVSDCRGKGKFIRFGGEWGYTLTIVSDTDGEKITFKATDSGTGQIYDISDSIIFKAGASENKDIDKPLRADTVYPGLGHTGKSLDLTLTGFGFDENTRVLMYPDIGNSKAIIASVDIPGQAQSIAVSGSTAYVACSGDSGNGLYIIDISDLEKPRIIGSFPTENIAGIAVSGMTVFISGNWSLEIIDVSDPAKPQTVGRLDTPGNASGIAVSGTTVFAANSGLQVIDVSDPAKPRIIGSVDMPRRAESVAVSGTTVFVADGYEGLQIITVSNPEKPRIIASVDTADMQDIAVSGTTVYAADYQSGLQIIDVSSPENPRIVGSAGILGTAGTDNVAVSGTTAFVTQGNSLQVINVSDPTQPRVIASVEQITGDIAVSGATVFAAGQGLQIIALSKLISGSADTPGYALGVAVSGTTAYIADWDKGLQIVSVSDPAKPQIIASVDMPGYVTDVAVSGTTAYAACGNYEEQSKWKGLQIIDVSVPAMPRIIGSFATPGGAYGIAVSGTNVYVSCGRYEEWSGLQIVAVNDPANPRLIGAIATPGYVAADVVISGTAAYMADGGSLQVIDVNDPANPRIIASLALSGYADALSIALSGTTAYIVDINEGLQIIDVNDPANPQIIASADIPGAALDVSVSGATAYVTSWDDDKGLQIIDVSEPKKPHIIASCYTLGPAQGVAVSDDTAFVGAGGSGLLVIPLTRIGSVTVNSETSLSLTLPGPSIPGHYTLSISDKERMSEIKGAVTFSDIIGDLNGDIKLDLKDAVTAFKTVSGTDDLIWYDYASAGIDVNGDKRVGIHEAVYILREIASALPPIF